MMKRFGHLFSKTACAGILILALLMTSYCGFAASPVSVSFELETAADGSLSRQVILEGVSPAYAGKDITLRVWHPNKTQSDFTGTNDFEVFALIEQTKADENGAFAFQFTFNKNPGDYKADVKPAGESILPVIITVKATTALEALLSKLTPQTAAGLTATDFAPVFADAENMGIETSVYDNLSDQSKVIARVKEDAQAAAMTCEDFIDSLNRAVILEAFAQSNDGALLTSVINTYDEYLSLSALPGAENIYATYQGLADKAATVTELGKTTYTSIGTLLEVWKEKVVVQAVFEVSYYENLAPVLENNAAYLNLGTDYASYLANADLKEHVLEQMTLNKASIVSLQSLQTAFTTAVSSYSSGGGGGGGGTGTPGKTDNIGVGGDLTQPSVPAPSGGSAVSFSDIDGHWAKNTILELANQKIIAGKGDGLFCPDDMVTREEFVKMIVAAFDLQKNGAVSPFSDVAADRWSYPYIASASQAGVISGYGDTFLPSENITRQDMAVILYRTLLTLEIEPSKGVLDITFEDADQISGYATNSVAMLFSKGIIKGDGKNFYPTANATRAETAQIILNALQERSN